jgi:hypothetical protein
MSSECLKCEDNFCCIYLGHRTWSENCRRESCFCISCQLYSIDEKSLVVTCQNCSFLSECYGYKYLGKVNGRDSYILQRHCIDYCVVNNCSQGDEVTVELSRIISPPDCSHHIGNVDPAQTTDVHPQGASS